MVLKNERAGVYGIVKTFEILRSKFSRHELSPGDCGRFAGEWIPYPTVTAEWSMIEIAFYRFLPREITDAVTNWDGPNYAGHALIGEPRVLIAGSSHFPELRRRPLRIATLSLPDRGINSPSRARARARSLITFPVSPKRICVSVTPFNAVRSLARALIRYGQSHLTAASVASTMQARAYLFHRARSVVLALFVIRQKNLPVYRRCSYDGSCVPLNDVPFNK